MTLVVGAFYIAVALYLIYSLLSKSCIFSIIFWHLTVTWLIIWLYWQKFSFFSLHGFNGLFPVLTWSFLTLLEHWTTILHHQHWRCDPQCSSTCTIDEAHSFVVHCCSFILLSCFPQRCSPMLVLEFVNILAFFSNSETLSSSM